jgi:tight adherence protein B
MVLTIVLLVAVAVLALFLGMYRSAQRIQDLDERFADVAPELRAELSKTDEKPGGKERLDRWLGSAKFASRARARLSQANVKLTLTEFMLLRVGLMGLGFVLGWFISKMVIGGVLVAILASVLPNAYIGRLQQKRLKAFQDQLPDVLSMLVNSLRAGHGLLQAVNLVTQEMPEPTCEEFERVRRELNLGVSMREALGHLVDRIESDDLELMVTAINVQHEVGGNLAEILATISEVIRERVRILGEVRTMTAQQRMVGTVLAGLPFLLGTGLMMINPDYMKGLFQPGLPIMLAVGAVVMIIMGYVLMQRMLKIEV